MLETQQFQSKTSQGHEITDSDESGRSSFLKCKEHIIGNLPDQDASLFYCRALGCMHN